MSVLRRAIERWEPPSFAPIRPSTIREAAGGEREDTSDQVERARAELRTALASDRLDELNRRSLAFGLANPRDGVVDGNIDRLVREAMRRDDPASARAVLRAYLGTFNPEAPETTLLAGALSRLRGRLSETRARPIEQFRIAEPRAAVETVAKAAGTGGADMAMLEATRPPILTSPLGLRAVAMAITRSARTPNVVTYERLLNHMKGTDGKLTATARQYAYAALLRPFMDETAPDEIQKHIQVVILAEYGDPRVPSTPVPSLADDADGSVARECIGVLTRWLAIDTLNLFIEVISRTAVDRMFKQRRAFWLRYFEANLVTEFHVAFGSEAAVVARSIRAGKGSAIRWGQLRRTQESNQSVLLMRIGDLTIVEWSHNGSMRFWRSNTRGKPRLHASIYEGPDLKSGSIQVRNPRTNTVVDGIRHDPAGNWQGFAARVIQTETGVRV